MNVPNAAFSYATNNQAIQITGCDPRAVNLFDYAYRNPQPGRFERLMGRKIQPLLCLECEVTKQNLSNRHFDGLQVIAVDAIHGTLNRVEDFDYDFHPLKRSMQQRWIGVASAMLNDVNLPPIDVIQVGDTYYVKDGHHRVSAARALGCCYLDAVVEAWVEA